MKNEVWKDIKGYEGLYQVSNLGKIRSLINNKNMRLRKDKKGYLDVLLYKNGIAKRYRAHKLVAEAFLNKNDFKYWKNENCNKIDIEKLQINHKNEIKSDNRVSNLEYCTNTYNQHYGHCIEKRLKTMQGKNIFISIKVNQYDLQGNFIKTWDKIKDAKNELKIYHISQCCKGKRKTAGGYIWKYKETQ